MLFSKNHVMPSLNFPIQDTEAAEEGGTQAVKAQQRLRELILSGHLAAGSRMRLGQEGLLDALPGGGYAVRTFSERDVADAIELRGTLEGLAARLAAERGVSPALLQEADVCLDQIDQLMHQGGLDDDDFSGYVRLNACFHRLLSEMAGSAVLAREIERASSLPFASASGFVGVQASKPDARDLLVVAQHQHRQVLQAIAQREAGRAEALMREHSRIARHNLGLALQNPQPSVTPGVQLIKPKR